MQFRVLYHDIKVSPTLSHTVKTATKILQHREEESWYQYLSLELHVKHKQQIYIMCVWGEKIFFFCCNLLKKLLENQKSILSLANSRTKHAKCIPILAPKAELFNFRLIFFNCFIAFISWISIAKNHPAITPNAK